MADIEKVKRGWERCRKNTCPSIFSKEYEECEYTVGLYCRKDKLIEDTLTVIEELEERIAIMQEPVEKKWYPKSRMWECQGCGDVVRGIDKYCSHCGRKFIEEEGEQE